MIGFTSRKRKLEETRTAFIAYFRAGFERFAVGVGEGVEVHEAIEFATANRATPGAGGEFLEDGEGSVAKAGVRGG